MCTGRPRSSRNANWYFIGPYRPIAATKQRPSPEVRPSRNGDIHYFPHAGKAAAPPQKKGTFFCNVEKGECPLFYGSGRGAQRLEAGVDTGRSRSDQQVQRASRSNPEAAQLQAFDGAQLQAPLVVQHHVQAAR
jgi:hypothetical protein